MFQVLNHSRDGLLARSSNSTLERGGVEVGGGGVGWGWAGGVEGKSQLILQSTASELKLFSFIKPNIMTQNKVRLNYGFHNTVSIYLALITQLP